MGTNMLAQRCGQAKLSLAFYYSLQTKASSPPVNSKKRIN